MNDNMDTAFDHLWEQEERRALMERLQRDYPVWKRRRRTTLTAMASVVVLVVVGFSIFNFQSQRATTLLLATVAALPTPIGLMSQAIY